MNRSMKNLMFDFLVLIWKFLREVKQLKHLHSIDGHDRIVRSKYRNQVVVFQRVSIEPFVNVEHCFEDQQIVLKYVVELIHVQIRIFVDPNENENFMLIRKDTNFSMNSFF